MFVHDAVDYMVTERDLLAAMTTAFVHCRPGGVAVFVPDDTAETFEPSTGHGGSDGADGRAARYLEWGRGPDADGTVSTTYAFVLRAADGTVEAVHETHRHGLFGRAVWLRLLAEAGFVAEAVTEVVADDGWTPRELFVGRRSARRR